VARVVTSFGLVVASALALVLLVSTSWNPIQNTPSASHDLIGAPEFGSTETVPLTDFYDAPTPLPDMNPGSLMKTEPISGAPEGVKATRYMYLSTNIAGEPIPVTGALFESASGTPAAPRPLIGFAHGTTGLARICGVSQAPFTSGTTGAEFWGPEIKPLVDSGYVVAATDYQNMGAPGTPSYLVAQSEAYAVLDSMRAAVNLAPGRIDISKMALTGHSQGGQASLAAAQYSAEYAPELAIRGAVSQSTGMVVGLPLVAKQVAAGSDDPVGDSKKSEYVAFLVESWAKSYPDVIDPTEIMTPDGMEALPLTQELCGVPLREKFADKPLSAYVKSDLPSSFLRVANLNVPTGYVPFPVLITQGDEDESVVPEFTYATFRALCQTGTEADLQIYPDDDHNSILWTAQTPVLDWLAARLDQQQVPNGCVGRQ